MNIDDTRPTLSERLTSAGNSSDLTVSIEVRGDVDYLIAAGSVPARMGRYVYQLMADWDASAKPRPVTDADIQRVAEHMPRIKSVKSGRRGQRTVESLDLAGARAQLQDWREKERLRILSRLSSLPKLIDPHSGLLPWLVARGINNSKAKLLNVLGWWADRNCMACQGTAERNGRTCSTCRGSGHREIPHDRDGKDISEHIARLVDRARCNTRDGLAGMRHLKAYADGKL